MAETVLISPSFLQSHGTAEPSRVFAVESGSDWESLLQQANSQGSLIVAHFAADWCAPCRFIEPIFQELSRNYPEVIFLQVDVDDLKDVASKFEVKAMPTFLFIKEEQQIDRIVGANKDELEKRIFHYSQTLV